MISFQWTHRCILIGEFWFFVIRVCCSSKLIRIFFIWCICIVLIWNIYIIITRSSMCIRELFKVISFIRLSITRCFRNISQLLSRTITCFYLSQFLPRCRRFWRLHSSNCIFNSINIYSCGRVKKVSASSNALFF